MSIFRHSKFKKIFGKPLKIDECYDCIRITESSWDSTFCSVNPKYLAIITEAAGGGAFLVIPIEKIGHQGAEIPIVAGHKAAVLDIQFCPHNDNVIASASEDCTVKVWSIPENWLQDKTNLTEPIADLAHHQQRVGLVLWHPTAENILLSSGADNLVCLWNIETEEVLVEISFPDMIISASFNFNGCKLVTSCKDNYTRVVNPRTGDILTDGKCHEGAKPQQVVYLRDDRVFTTGFSRISKRQYALWNDTNLTKALAIERIRGHTSNGVMFPYYDQDCNLIYLSGKGDSSIRYFEYCPEEAAVHYLGHLDSKDPQRGIGWMPKRGVNVNQNEIARGYKLHLNKNLCEVIPFKLPRKSEDIETTRDDEKKMENNKKWFSFWISRRDVNVDINIIMSGLVNAGKTTIMKKLSCGRLINEGAFTKVNCRNLHFAIFNILQGVVIPSITYKGIIFVVDGMDQPNMVDSKNRLHELLAKGELIGSPLLILFNKCEGERFTNEKQAIDILGLNQIENHVVPSPKQTPTCY